MVDTPDGQMLTGFIQGHVFDDPVVHQLRDDVIPLGIGIIIGETMAAPDLSINVW
jgi:hypothetical protein